MITAVLSYYSYSRDAGTRDRQSGIPGRGEQVSTTSITELARHPDLKNVAQPEVEAPVRSGN